jgi:hypothetical protein
LPARLQAPETDTSLVTSSDHTVRSLGGWGEAAQRR